MGLRHADSFGPIGSGISTPLPNAGSYAPAYPGPANAAETGQHIMASNTSTGQTLDQYVGQVCFGEREDVKLQFDQTGSVVAEQAAAHETLNTAQNITLAKLTVPNTLLSGMQNFGKTFNVQALDITGSISANNQLDFYKFSAPAGLLEVEVMATNLPGTRASALNPEIRIFLRLRR